MKTGYDEPYEEDEADNISAETADEYHSYEAPDSEDCGPSEGSEATSALTYEESVAQSYEASFAKCKVAPVAARREALVAETYEYEASFARCSLASVTEATEKHESPIETNYEASFARCFLPPVTESLETPVIEQYEAPVAEIDEAQPVSEIHEAHTANVTPQTNYTPNLPPPVPRRTLLPNKTTKETVVASETPRQEISVETEESDVQTVAYRDIELVSPEDVPHRTETCAERWSDSTSVSLPGQVEDVETVSSDPGKSQCEPVSEMYYTASSEVSLLSDTELADKVQTEDDEGKDDRKNVISGHVAAMRERFESMTRTNTPCPDLIRSLSPSLEVFRNMSPSPDRLA